MAEHEFHYWTHGVNLIVQDEPNPADNIRRNSQGTRVRQNAGENWFHFGVTTASLLDGHPVKYVHAYLKGHINGEATVQSVHVYEGGYEDGVNIGTKRIWARDDLRLSSRPLDDLDINLPDSWSNEPIVICIRAEFVSGGEIYFAGAGIRLHEITR
jgi:hypothetical protein